VEIEFKTKKLQRIFCSHRELTRVYGDQMAKKIKLRLAVLESAPSLADVPVAPPVRCHHLRGRMKGDFAVDLIHPHRLVFRAAHDPIPRNEDGEVDMRQITVIQITEVVDYH